MDYFKFRQYIENLNERTSVKDLSVYKDRDRKGQARMYIDKKDFKNVDNLSKILKNVSGNFHISSFDGLDTNPKDVELYGDMKVLQQIRGSKVFKN